MTVETAVVLGPGGPVGTAWLAGLAAGLRREGVDLGTADLIVGTSAGAIVGAILATGGDLDRLAVLPPSTGPGGMRTDPQRLAEVLATLNDTELERTEALRRVGRLAVTASTGGEDYVIARMRSLVGAAHRPRHVGTPISGRRQTGSGRRQAYQSVFDDHVTNPDA